MKYIRLVLCILAIMSAGMAAAHANVPIDIVVNDKFVNSDAEPFIENSRTLVPVRAISNALNCDVSWEEKAKKATIEDDGIKIEVVIGKNTATVNGVDKPLDAPAKIVDKRTYLPIRFVSEYLGANVGWDQETYTVIIRNDGETVSNGDAVKTDYTLEDLVWLAKIVNAEAEGEPMDGKIAVANVVLNRVGGEGFPDSVYDVVFDRRGGVQFTPVANGTIYNQPTRDSYRAAKSAVFGNNLVDECMFFCNPVTSQSDWMINSRQLYKSIGNHDFYY